MKLNQIVTVAGVITLIGLSSVVVVGCNNANAQALKSAKVEADNQDLHNQVQTLNQNIKIQEAKLVQSQKLPPPPVVIYDNPPVRKTELDANGNLLKSTIITTTNELGKGGNVITHVSTGTMTSMSNETDAAQAHFEARYRAAKLKGIKDGTWHLAHNGMV